MFYRYDKFLEKISYCSTTCSGGGLLIIGNISEGQLASDDDHTFFGVSDPVTIYQQIWILLYSWQI